MAVQPTRIAGRLVAPAVPSALGMPSGWVPFYRIKIRGIRVSRASASLRPTPARALCASERAHVARRTVPRPERQRFVDRSPAEVVAIWLLKDEGQYLCAERTMLPDPHPANQPVLQSGAMGDKAQVIRC